MNALHAAKKVRRNEEKISLETVATEKNSVSALIDILKSHGSSARDKNSLLEFIEIKEKEYAKYEAQLRDAEHRCATLDHLLKTTRRNQRNRSAYNNLIEQRAEANKELTLLLCNAPNKSVFYEQISLFLETQQQKEEFALSHAAMMATEETGTLPPAPQALIASHCALRITSAAPVYDACQFKTLVSFRKQDAAKSSKALEIIDRVIMHDICGTDKMEKIASPIVFLLSAAGCGVAAPLSAQKIGNPGTERFQTVKIGKVSALAPGESTCERILPLNAERNETDMSRDSAATLAANATAGKKKAVLKAKNTRLKIKNKDIRNMENLSIENFVHVEEREKTLEEIQVENLRLFIQKCNSENENQKRPRYEDPVCSDCNVALEIDLHNGSVSCPACGKSHDDGIENHKWHAIEHISHSRFEYLQSSHLSLLLKHVQAKETTMIPRTVLDRISTYLDNQNIDRATLTWRKMRTICSKLDLPKYYNHVWLICYQLGGPLVVQFSEVQEAEFLAVFDVLEKVYPLFKPANAENFIFYWYIIGKTAQLLGHSPEIVRQFPLLKHPRNHMQKEKLWRKMMDHLGWPFFETVHESAIAIEE